MGSFLAYILKSAICLALFYLFYRLWLSKETFHRINRYFLLFVLGLSAVLPLLEWRIQEPAAWQQPLFTLEQLLAMPYAPAGEVVEEGGEMSGSWVTGALLLLYGLGVFFFFGRNLYSLLRLARLLSSCRRESVTDYLPEYSHGAVLMVHEQEVAPFSWLHYVVVSRKDLQDNAREILYHELAHIRKHHSWDLLLSDGCIFLQWFNPASWLLKQELQTLHEYEADEAVLQAGVNAKQYQLLIIKKAVGTRLYSMANSLNHSSLKKRITMMMKKKSNPWARWKYLYVLPVAAIAVTAFARPEVSSVAKEISSAKISDLKSIIEINSPVNQDTVKYVPVSKEKVGQLRGKVLSVADELPKFSDGGTPGLMKYIDTHLEYPEAAKKAGKQGRVIVQFVVETDGSLSHVHVFRSLDPELDAAAIRVFQDMPKWIPGKQDGVPVAVKYTVPVKFELPKSSDKQSASMKNNNQKDVVILVNGKEISQEELKKIDPSTIQSMIVIKDSLAIQSEGKKAKNGIIKILLKDDAPGVASAVADVSVKGLVVDEAGDPIIGATVLIAGTQNGTVTDAEGVFTLQAPKDALLKVSYIGVGTEQVKVQPVVKVILKKEKL